MRPPHESIIRLLGPAAALTWALALAAAIPAFAQSTAASVDSRYYTPPIAEPAVGTARGESLLSYRRDDATTHNAGAAPAEPPTRLAAAPPGKADVNPLRKAPEPPAEVQPAASSEADSAIPMTMPAPTQSPPAPSVTDEANATPLPTAAGAVNPFPDDMPSASLPPAAPLPSHQAETQPIAPQQTEPLLRYDAAVALASHEEPKPHSDMPAVTPSTNAIPASDAATRRLAPPTAAAADAASEVKSSTGGSLPFAFTKLESFSTAGAGLAIVVGLFLICVWMLRRGGAKTSGVLPADAFAVLGRAPLTPQSFAHLLRLGNKLVLVAMSPDGIQPLTEITDPMEVDRLTGLCASGRGHGPSAEFQQVLAQLSREPARGFLGGEVKEGRRR
jgi:flagellar biogenesis protein FliO